MSRCWVMGLFTRRFSRIMLSQWRLAHFVKHTVVHKRRQAPSVAGLKAANEIGGIPRNSILFWGITHLRLYGIICGKWQIEIRSYFGYRRQSMKHGNDLFGIVDALW